jgi:hypothetical protein
MKKRLVITEGERSKILNMHGFKQMISEATLADVQTALNSKFGAGLTADGKLGPKTIAAIERALGGTPVTPTSGSTETDIKLTPKPVKPIDINRGPTDLATADKGESSSAAV